MARQDRKVDSEQKDVIIKKDVYISGYEIRSNSCGGYAVFCDGKATGFESVKKGVCEEWIRLKR